MAVALAILCINKSEEFYSKFPHLKKYKPKAIKKSTSEQQQSSILESDGTENDKKELNLSRYKKADVSTKHVKPDQLVPNNDDLSSSDDNGNGSDSFERDDVEVEAENVDLSPEIRKKIDKIHNQNNENILQFLDKSRAIDITKPKDLKKSEN